MLKEFRPAITSFLLLTIITGIAYPFVVTAVAQKFMPERANGSLIVKEGRTMGSALIGQNFSDPKYFWGRPSATAPQPYNASASSGSNQGPTNPALVEAIKARIQALTESDPDNIQAIPVDLITASGSGLDPHISPSAAEYQVQRVAHSRGLSIEKVRKIVALNTESRNWEFWENRG